MRATNLMFRDPKEQTPDPYHYKTLNDGRSLDYDRKETRSTSFSQAPRFLTYKTLAKRTQPNVGPGSYLIIQAIERLKQKPCMAKLSQTTLFKEDCYEMVNNMRVLQPQYLKGKEKHVYQKSLEKFKNMKHLRKINESFVFQRSLFEPGQDSVPQSRDHNRSFDKSFDFKVHERPKTQQVSNLANRRRLILNYRLSQFTTNPSISNIQFENQAQSQQNLSRQQNLHMNMTQKNSHNGHSFSLMNGSTNASFDHQMSQTMASGITSHKAKSIRVRQGKNMKKIRQGYYQTIDQQNKSRDESPQFNQIEVKLAGRR